MPTILSASKAARRLLSLAQQHTGRKDGLGLLMKTARSRGQFVQSRGLRNIAGIEYPAVDKVINFDKELNVKGNSLGKMGLSTGQARWFLGCGDGEEGNVLSKTHEERKVMGYSPEQVFAVVAAVDLYEDFVPWCQHSKVVRRNSDGSFDAELEIGFKFLVESYVSHVEMKKPSSIKTTASESSLFDHLINIWEFKPGPVPGTCDLYFFVDFKFQSPLYRQVASMFFKEVVSRLVSSFRDRCRTIYGPGVRVLENSYGSQGS